MKKEDLKDAMSKVLDAHYSRDESGLFYSEIYTDYQDELSEESLRKILASKDPKETFREAIDSGYEMAIAEEEWAAEEKLLKDPDLKAAYEEDEDLFRDTLFELFYVRQPYDHFLRERIDVNIVLDTGDCNYDFIHNSFAHGYYGDRKEEVDGNSSLLWLCRQQGVSKEELEHALKTGSCYPRALTDMMERHESTITAMKALGYRPDNSFNQEKEYKKLLNAEHAVRDLEKKIARCKSNLAECDLPYEAFCDKWLSIHDRKKRGQTPPDQEHWSNLRQDIQQQNAEKLAVLIPQLDAAREHLAYCMQDPNVRMAADLRDRLQEINLQYVPMLQSEEYKKGRFLASVIQESANVTSHMNALTALVRMPLSEAIDLAAVIHAEESLNDSYYPDQRKGKSSIVLSKDSVLGLYCPWQGAGSLFEIKLAKPVEIPVRLIHDANVDGYLGYGIQSIYGGLDYEESLLEIKVDPDLIKEPFDQQLASAKESSGMLRGNCTQPDINQAQQNKETERGREC